MHVTLKEYIYDFMGLKIYTYYVEIILTWRNIYFIPYNSAVPSNINFELQDYTFKESFCYAVHNCFILFSFWCEEACNLFFKLDSAQKYARYTIRMIYFKYLLFYTA